MWIEVSTNDFLAAIERLKPQRLLKAYGKKDFQISMQQGYAIFSVEDVAAQALARGEWSGAVAVPYSYALIFLKVKPSGDLLRIAFEDGRLAIGTSRVNARLVDLA